MASGYSVVSQVRGVRVMGPTQVLDVETVGFVTHPTGIYAEYPVPLDLWKAGDAGTLLAPLAQQIEQQIAEGLAKTGSYVNDVDDNGLLVDYIDYVVEYRDPSGFRPPQTTVVRVSLESLLGGLDPWAVNLEGSVQNLLVAAYDALAATAGL